MAVDYYSGAFSGAQIDAGIAAAIAAAPQSTTYTQSETNALLEQKADKSEVTASVAAAVSQIVADAPGDFDTLKEMSDWIAQHEDSASAMNTAILQNAADIGNIETIITAALVSGENLSGSSGADLNTVTTSGQHKYTGGPANFPGGQNYGVLLVFNPRGSNYVVQIAISGVNASTFGSASSAGVYVRATANSGTDWSAWQKLAFANAAGV